jgi:hypothetical protein
MCVFRIVLLFLTLFSSQLFASESQSSSSQQQLVVQPSQYIKFTSSSIVTLNGIITFDGKFIILGEGVYGHFDLVAFNDSGKIIQQTKSADRAYRRHSGVKTKSVKINLDNASECIKVEVTFHEMRVEPKAGACILKH